jgi:hypothetical protein
MIYRHILRHAATTAADMVVVAGWKTGYGDSEGPTQTGVM